MKDWIVAFDRVHEGDPNQRNLTAKSALNPYRETLLTYIRHNR